MTKRTRTTTKKTTRKSAPKGKATRKPKAAAAKPSRKARGLKNAPGAGRPSKAKTGKGISLIDAAVKILAAGGNQPMKPSEIVTEAGKRNLWKSPEGKTPHATLYGAIFREIKVKGKESRFVKAGTGAFKLTPEGVKAAAA